MLPGVSNFVHWSHCSIFDIQYMIPGPIQSVLYIKVWYFFLNARHYLTTPPYTLTWTWLIPFLLVTQAQIPYHWLKRSVWWNRTRSDLDLHFRLLHQLPSACKDHLFRMSAKSDFNATQKIELDRVLDLSMRAAIYYGNSTTQNKRLRCSNLSKNGPDFYPQKQSSQLTLHFHMCWNPFTMSKLQINSKLSCVKSWVICISMPKSWRLWVGLASTQHPIPTAIIKWRICTSSLL